MEVVFEGLRIYEGQIFKLNEHIQRLYKSASILDLEISYNEKVVIDVCKKITQKQNVKNGYIRPVVWRGSEMMAISALEASTNLAIACWNGRHTFLQKSYSKELNLLFLNGKDRHLSLHPQIVKQLAYI